MQAIKQVPGFYLFAIKFELFELWANLIRNRRCHRRRAYTDTLTLSLLLRDSCHVARLDSWYIPKTIAHNLSFRVVPTYLAAHRRYLPFIVTGFITNDSWQCDLAWWMSFAFFFFRAELVVLFVHPLPGTTDHMIAPHGRFAFWYQQFRFCLTNGENQLAVFVWKATCTAVIDAKISLRVVFC